MSEITPSTKSICHQCDWVSDIPPLERGDVVSCPRCGYKLFKKEPLSVQNEIAWSVAALVVLVVALSFEFISFEVSGIKHSIVFVDTVRVLFNFDYVFLGILVFLTTVILPSIYLLIILYLDIGIALEIKFPGTLALARTIRSIKPWLMSDVFIIGVLVSLIKIVTLANIHIGPSFVAFCAYALLMLKTLSSFNVHRLWQHIGDNISPPENIIAGRTAQEQNMTSCTACDQLFDYHDEHFCPRCGKRHISHHIDRLQITWALILTGTLLFIPANLYPILETSSLGNNDPQTIVGGVLHLTETGSWPIALIIFVASILIPIAKIFALSWLCIKARTAKSESHHDKMRLYHITEMVGRWSMVDVFVVAVLVSLVQAGVFITITPGPAAVYFAGVVIVTMIAAITFDTRLIWLVSSGNADED